MIFEAFMQNTMPKTEQWHLEAMSNQARYFARHGIRYNVMDASHYGVRKVNELGYESAHLIKKILRLYDVVERDIDYGIFMDLDTVVLNPDRDIKDCVLSGFNYVEKATFMRHPNVEKIPPWVRNHLSLPVEHLASGWFAGVFKKTTICDVWSKINGIEPSKYCCNFSTGYGCFSNDLCRTIIKLLKEKDLCPLTKSGIDRIREITHRSLKIFDDLDREMKASGKRVDWSHPLGAKRIKWFLNDEDLLGLVSMDIDVDEEWKMRNAKDSFQSCALWDVTQSNKWWDSQFDWDKLYEEQSVFLHMIGGAKYKDGNKQLKLQQMFKVV